MSSYPTPVPAPRSASRRSVKLAEKLSQEIVADVSRLGMKPRDRLASEVAMAQDLGVSRTSVREALRILEVHGLITIRTGPGGGPEVAEMGADDFTRMATLHFHVAKVTFRQLLEARRVLEPQMARLAAEKRTPAQLELLKRIMDGHEIAVVTTEHTRCSHAFHDLIAEMAGNGNQVLSLMTSSLHSIFEVHANREHSPEAVASMTRIHGRIADAIDSEDGAAAAKLMERHMRASEETFAREHPTLIDSIVAWPPV